MIKLGGKADSLEQGKKIAQQTIDDGSAFEKLKEITKVQGGDAGALDDFSKMPAAKHQFDLIAEQNGFIEKIDALAIGKGALLLEAGRATLESVIDPAVGVILKKKIGDPVKKGETILEIKYNKQEVLADAKELFQSAYSFSNTQPSTPSLIKAVLGDLF